MTKVLKRLDLLIKEVRDPHAQENFWRLKRILEDLELSGGSGSVGPQGPTGPAGPPGTPTILFATDAGTVAGDLVRINAANTVTKITDNLTATIPNGIFGVGLSKPSSLQIEIMFLGVVGGYSGLTTGGAVFISTAGTPTQTPPASGMLQQIGFAISSAQIMVNLMQPMRRA